MASIEEQLIDSSKIIIDLVAANIGHNQELFDEAVRVMLIDKHPVSMRSARVIQFISGKRPEKVKPHIENFIEKLPQAKIDGVKRSILKILIENPILISDGMLGKLADTCFNFIVDEKEAIAVRAFSIDILLLVAKKYPEIEPELIAVMENAIPEGSKGLKNKCRKTINWLNKKNKNVNFLK